MNSLTLSRGKCHCKVALLWKGNQHYDLEAIIKDKVGKRHFREPIHVRTVQALANANHGLCSHSVHAASSWLTGAGASDSAVNTLPSQCRRHHTNHLPKHRAVSQLTGKVSETICSRGRNYRQENGELFSFLYDCHSWKTLRSEPAVEGGVHCVSCIFWFAAVTFQIFKFLSRYFNFLQQNSNLWQIVVWVRKLFIPSDPGLLPHERHPEPDQEVPV